VLAAADLTTMRPGTGIPPAELDALVGRSLARAVEAGQLLDRDALE
jgi:sialic acid synthase SpsE